MYLTLVVVLAVLSTAFSANVRKEAIKLTADLKQKHMDSLKAHLVSQPRKASPLTKAMKEFLAKTTENKSKAIDAMAPASSSKAVATKNSFSPKEMDEEMYWTGNYAYIQSMTHSDTKLEKRKKRCRANLDKDQVWETHAIPLGCKSYGTSSTGTACFVDPMTTETRITVGSWKNSPNCNGDAEGNPLTGPDSEFDAMKEPKCYQDMTYFGSNPEDAFGGPVNYQDMSPEDREKYPWSLQKIACGPNPAPWSSFNGIIEVSYDSFEGCNNNMIQTSDSIWGHMLGSCIDYLDTQTDADGNNAVDANGNRIWFSYKILGCSAATDETQGYGLGGSNAILGIYMTKGCKDEQFLYEFTDLPSSVFLGYSGAQSGACGASPDGYYTRAYCMNMP